MHHCVNKLLDAGFYLYFSAQVHDLRGDLDPLLQAIQNALGIVELEICNTHCTFAINFC